MHQYILWRLASLPKASSAQGLRSHRMIRRRWSRISIFSTAVSGPGLVWCALILTGCDIKDRSAPDLVWGVHGTKPGWLHKPRVAAFDGQDRLYIADLTDRIQ